MEAMNKPVKRAKAKKFLEETDSRRYHTDETRLCENCHQEGSATKRLLRCKGCEYSWYCTAACQKQHWPAHKPTCLRYQAEKKWAPTEVIRMQEALREWVRVKDPALGFAGNEALLPARDRPDHNLLETHILSVNLNETVKGSGELEVVNVRIGEHKELLENFKYLSNEEGYYDLIRDLKRMREGVEAKTGEKVFGTMFTMIRCVADGHVLMQVHPLFIKQQCIVEKMLEDYREDWPAQFRMFASVGSKMYKAPNGSLFMMAQKS